MGFAGRTRLAIAATGLAVAGICAAAAADVDVGSSAGLNYVEDYGAFTAGPSSLTVDAACPVDRHVVGGGTGTSAPATPDTFVNSTYPADDGDADRRPGDRWVGSAVNLSPGTPSMVATAICARRAPRYVRERAQLGAGASRSLTAGCPRDLHVVGGGSRVGGAALEAHLNTSAPHDGRDRDTRPDDGWRTRAVNLSGPEKRLTTYAVCARTRVRYVSQAAGTPYAFATCPGSRVVIGGGIAISGAPSEARAVGVDPYAESTNPPDDGYIALQHTLSGPPTTLITHAICK